MPAAPATKAAIQRAIEATQAAGLTPSAVTVSKDGSVRVETARNDSLDKPNSTAQVVQPKQWSKR